MIVEFVGQSSIGKTYNALAITKKLKENGYPVFDFERKKPKNTFLRRIKFSFYLIPLFTIKSFHLLISLIKKSTQDRKKRKDLLKRFLGQSMYLRMASLNAGSDDIIILQESFFTTMCYIAANNDSLLNEETINLIDKYVYTLTKKKHHVIYILIKSNVDYFLLQKEKRAKKENYQFEPKELIPWFFKINDISDKIFSFEPILSNSLVHENKYNDEHAIEQLYNSIISKIVNS